jgi:hypothetical protein
MEHLDPRKRRSHNHPVPCVQAGEQTLIRENVPSSLTDKRLHVGTFYTPSPTLHIMPVMGGCVDGLVVTVCSWRSVADGWWLGVA